MLLLSILYIRIHKVSYKSPSIFCTILSLFCWLFLSFSTHIFFIFGLFSSPPLSPLLSISHLSFIFHFLFSFLFFFTINHRCLYHFFFVYYISSPHVSLSFILCLHFGLPFCLSPLSLLLVPSGSSLSVFSSPLSTSILFLLKVTFVESWLLSLILNSSNAGALG